MIEAVIYDMDGVLINSEPLWREAEIAIFKNVGLPFTEDMCRETMGMRTYEVIEYWYSKTPWQGASIKEVEQNLLNKVTNLIIEKGQAMDGVYNSIDFFKEKGLKIALASSSASSLINTVLSKIKLNTVFEITNSAEYLSFGKPHPEVFINTAQQLNVKPINCLVIEDSFHGLLAAKSALMKTVVIPDKESKNDPRFNIADYNLRSLNEINQINFG